MNKCLENSFLSTLAKMEGEYNECLWVKFFKTITKKSSTVSQELLTSWEVCTFISSNNY